MGSSQEIDVTSVHFLCKPRHVTPQIDHLGKTNPVLRFSTHIYGFFEEINGKTFNCESKPRHVTPQIESSQKNKLCFEGFNTLLWGFSEHRCENIHF